MLWTRLQVVAVIGPSSHQGTLQGSHQVHVGWLAGGWSHRSRGWPPSDSLSMGGYSPGQDPRVYLLVVVVP